MSRDARGHTIPQSFPSFYVKTNFLLSPFALHTYAMKGLTKMKDRFHLTLMISTDLYLDGLLNGEYFWYYICKDGKTTYMNECNPFMVLWTQSSLESVPECWILHLDCWVRWNMCNITSRQRAPYWLRAEEGPCALFISARLWAGARPWNVVQLYLGFLQGIWINDVWSWKLSLTGKLGSFSRIQE